jgi:hypothetical protein
VTASGHPVVVSNPDKTRGAESPRGARIACLAAETGTHTMRPQEQDNPFRCLGMTQTGRVRQPSGFMKHSGWVYHLCSLASSLIAPPAC